MERKFYKDEFESFLEEQANNHKMFPSDRVWGNIHGKLHEDKTWPALTIAALVFLAATIAIGTYFSPKPNIFAYQADAFAKAAQQSSSAPNSLIGSVSNSKDKRASIWAFNPQEKSFSTKKTGALVTGAIVENQTENTVGRSKKTTTSQPAIQTEARFIAAVIAPAVETKKPFAERDNEAEAGDSFTDDNLTYSNAESSKLAEQFNAEKNSVIFGKEQEKMTPLIQLPKAGLDKGITKLFRKKFSYLVYITPSASFRNLKEDGTFLDQKTTNSPGPLDISNVTDVNKVVRHAPGRGAEAGISLRYDLGDKVRVTTGLQLNVRQYSIEAYAGNAEQTTIELQRNSRIDSVIRYSYYRANNGVRPTEIVNRYYQLSMPIGLEWEVLGSKDVGFNIAASVQPTYNLNNDSYLISTNFKNYTQSGSILRNWNINTNIEAFVNFKNGDYRWQIGPQFRYQQMSSFIKAYPIKENLLDYGLKIGVSKVIQ